MKKETKRTNNTPSEPNGERSGQPLLCEVNQVVQTKEGVKLELSLTDDMFRKLTTERMRQRIVEGLHEKTINDYLASQIIDTIVKQARKDGEIKNIMQKMSGKNPD